MSRVGIHGLKPTREVGRLITCQKPLHQTVFPRRCPGDEQHAGLLAEYPDLDRLRLVIVFEQLVVDLRDGDQGITDEGGDDDFFEPEAAIFPLRKIEF